MQDGQKRVGVVRGWVDKLAARWRSRNRERLASRQSVREFEAAVARAQPRSEHVARVKGQPHPGPTPESRYVGIRAMMEWLCRCEMPYVKKLDDGRYEQGHVKPTQCTPEPEPRDARGHLVSWVQARRKARASTWMLGKQEVVTMGIAGGAA